MTDKEKLKQIKKLEDAMYDAARFMTTDASRLHKAMDEYHKFIIHECKEEPVSEELEEASKNHAVERFRTTRDEFLAEKCKWSFKAGAQWQKQQMLEKSFGATVCKYLNTYLKEMDRDAISQALREYTNGDRVRVVIIK
jgi:hypothetical protein